MSYEAKLTFPDGTEMRTGKRFAASADAKKEGRGYIEQMVPQAVGQQNIARWQNATVSVVQRPEPPDHHFVVVKNARIIQPI